MSKIIFFGIIVLILLPAGLTFTLHAQPVRASGTIIIKSDGSIDPPDAPISTADNVTYFLTDNIFDEIRIERSNMTLDGNGYVVQGTGFGTGVFIRFEKHGNITIRNMEIREFSRGIIFDDSSNNVIAGNNITSNDMDGIRLMSSSNNTIVGNYFDNNGYGIYLSSSSNNTIVGNSVTSNNQHGIRLSSSANNTIMENRIMSNGQAGIYVSSAYYSPYNNIIRNNIASNRHGIYLCSLSNDNSITENNITANIEAGIFIWHSSNNTFYKNNIAINEVGIYIVGDAYNNTFYHNNIVDNTNQVYFQFSGYPNVWDNGYPSGGNYWSDYAGADANHDGIGDTPYIIDVSNIDNYPLMSFYTPQRIFVFTDKVSYHAGDVMKLGLHVMNLEDPIRVCVAVWLELTDGSKRVILHSHNTILPAGLDYYNPSFKKFTLPSLKTGTYTWHATLFEPTMHRIIVEDTAVWQFS